MQRINDNAVCGYREIIYAGFTTMKWIIFLEQYSPKYVAMFLPQRAVNDYCCGTSVSLLSIVFHM